MSWNARVLVGQSGGPTAAINASLAGVVQIARALGAEAWGMRHGVQGLLADDVVDLARTLPDAASLELLRQTPASYLGSCRYKLPDADADPATYERLFRTLEARRVDAVLYIGGNDSMDTIAKLSAWGTRAGNPVRFIGVPKTIDNDLEGTDHTPGFGSAAKFVATSVAELGRDASVYDLPNVLVVEVMGRGAGWLAGASCLARQDGLGHPDLILLPEAPVSEDALVEAVRGLLARKRCVVVAASEGARRPDGSLMCEPPTGAVRTDAFGHAAALSGTGRHLAQLLGERLGVKTRAVELSTLQRCASHLASACDLAEAAALGGVAVRAAAAGETGVMPAIRREGNSPYLVSYGLADVSAVANAERRVPAAWIREDGMDVTSDFADYVRPLVAGEVAPLFVDGLPLHVEPLA